jgi:transcriptional regulator with XRE-family HTH domain
MLGMTDKLSGFISRSLKERSWSMRELARRSGLSVTTISDVVSGKANPGLDFCRGVARALDLPPEMVLRLAGLLPSVPESTLKEQRVRYYFNRLSPEQQELILETMKAWYEASRGDKTDEG